MTPNELSILSPILQLGAFGTCALLIALLWWHLRDSAAAYKDNTKAMVGNTQVLSGLTTMVDDVRETSQDVRDRLLGWQCPFRDGDGVVQKPLNHRDKP